MLFPGHIIWPISLSSVNLTDFPLEQQAVPNVLGPKRCQNKWTPQDASIIVSGGGLSQPSFACALFAAMPVYSARFSPLFTSKRSDFSVFVARSHLFRYTLCWMPHLTVLSGEISPEFFPISAIVSIYARSRSVFIVISSLFLGVVPFLLLARSSGPWSRGFIVQKW